MCTFPSTANQDHERTLWWPPRWMCCWRMVNTTRPPRYINRLKKSNLQPWYRLQTFMEFQLELFMSELMRPGRHTQEAARSPGLVLAWLACWVALDCPIVPTLKDLQSQSQYAFVTASWIQIMNTHHASCWGKRPFQRLYSSWSRTRQRHLSDVERARCCTSEEFPCTTCSTSILIKSHWRRFDLILILYPSINHLTWTAPIGVLWRFVSWLVLRSLVLVLDIHGESTFTDT